ncbi:MAG TPA: GntR family transcriptional regulator [Trebonia sp.]
MTVDHDGAEPVYRQVAAILRERIQQGLYAPGRPIPSEPQLVQEFGIARETARKAGRVLAEDGWVRVVRGRGVFVIER